MPLDDFLKELNVLDASQIQVTLDEDKSLLDLKADGKVLAGLTPVKPFPITYPEYVIFRDSGGVDVCVIRNYLELDVESRRDLEILLDKMFFIPKILKIERAETSGDEFEWEVATDKGPKVFRTRGKDEHCVYGQTGHHHRRRRQRLRDRGHLQAR
jgi:hypothetical protein